jgi:glycosyltransferase involved in cell wall biosynthesis
MTESSPGRILLITYEYPPVGGGTGKAAMNTAIGLADRGYDATVLTARVGELPRDAVENGVRVIRIPVLRRHLNYANALEVLSFAASGVPRIRRIARRIRPRLVLAYMTIPCGIVADHLRAWDKVPYYILLRGQDVPGYPETRAWMHAVAKPLTRFLWRRAERVIANSDGLAELARRTMPDLGIEVIRNGVDLARYRPRARPGSAQPGSAQAGSARPGSAQPGSAGILPANPDEQRSPRSQTAGPRDLSTEHKEIVRLIYVGRLIRKKRIHEALEAFARIAAGESAGRSEFVIVGHGPERAALERLARERGVGDRVTFTGRLEEEGVVEQLRRSDVFINLADGEGLPNAVLEAMACGLPVVLSDIAPHHELIDEGAEGLFCLANEPRSVSDALGRLFESQEKRDRMGQAARARVEKDFVWSRATDALIGLIEGKNSTQSRRDAEAR